MALGREDMELGREGTEEGQGRHGGGVGKTWRQGQGRHGVWQGRHGVGQGRHGVGQGRHGGRGREGTEAGAGGFLVTLHASSESRE